MYRIAYETVQLLLGATTIMFRVNSNRYLPQIPAISLSELSEKQLQTELEGNVFIVH